ncbi:MAG: hypothetical protein NTV43_07245 [Methylococcales bacterium]|nr:hypothetical protein [Methylococcales bacterium]
MSVSHSDFYTAAEALLNNSNSTEIDFRNLISRSYYAVFHLSREISANFATPIDEAAYQKLGSHEKVISKFEKHSDKRFQALAILIRQRKAKRTKADYDIHLDIKRQETAQHFHAVKGLLAKLEALKPVEKQP